MGVLALASAVHCKPDAAPSPASAATRDAAHTEASPRPSASVVTPADAAARDAALRLDGRAPRLDAAEASAPDASKLPLYEVAKPLSGKSIGHTSVVFKLKLEQDLVVAYKPSSKRGPSRYKGEIAAYRLATALGLPNVPPAIPRSFPLAGLLAALGGKDTDAGGLLAREALPDEKGEVAGALIPWIPRLGFLALEAEPLLGEWKGWLGASGEVPADKRSVAAQVSTMIVFDYITGNWDRWSGGNVGHDPQSGTVLFIDNDGAFYETPPRESARGQRSASRRSRASRAASSGGCGRSTRRRSPPRWGTSATACRSSPGRRSPGRRSSGTRRSGSSTPASPATASRRCSSSSERLRVGPQKVRARPQKRSRPRRVFRTAEDGSDSHEPLASRLGGGHL